MTSVQTSIERARRVITRAARLENTPSEEESRKRSKVLHENLEKDQAELKAILEGVGREAYVPHTTNPFQPIYANVCQPQLSTYGQHNAVDNRMQPNQNNALDEMQQYLQHLDYQQQKTLEAVKQMLEPQQQIMEEQRQMIEQLQQMMEQQRQMMEQLQQMMEQQRQMMQQPPHHHQNTRRPVFIPLCSPSAVQEFDNINEDGYREVIKYLEFVGGSTLKEAVALSFRELFADSVVTSYSWLGREENKLCLAQTWAAVAIRDAMLQNKHFQTPTKKEIGDCLKVALRTAKERVRSRSLGPRIRQPQVVRNS